MNIGIIFFTAVANGLLQVISKNILYCYVFLIYTLGAMAIDLYDKKFGKIFMSFIFCSYALLLFVCVHNHFVYAVPVYDYVFVFAQTTIVTILTIIAILPIKEKSLPLRRETFSHRAMAQFII